MKTIVTTILYNKTIDASLTLRNLLANEFSDYELVIVNNGPKSITVGEDVYPKLKNKGICISILEFIKNKPLSHIYNDVINSNPNADRFIFLDDDSELDLKFFYKLNEKLNNNVHLQIPKIIERDNGDVYYPVINSKVFLGDGMENVSNDDYIYSIGSGLVIYRSLVDLFNQNKLDLFDSRFALYGVDVSLFRRISLLKKKNIIFNIQIVSFINHSLSRAESEISDWRYKERLYDKALSIRFYSDSLVKSIYRFSRALCRELLHMKFKNVILILRTFMSGKHPRC